MAKDKTERIEQLRGQVKESIGHDDVQRNLRFVAGLINRFLRNDQWLDFDTTRGIVQRIEYYDDDREPKDRPINNIIYPMWRTYKGLVLRSDPEVNAVPTEPGDIYDELGAQMAEIMVNYIKRSQFMRRRRNHMTNILLSYGGVSLHPYIEDHDNAHKRELKTIFIPPNQIYPYPYNATSWDNVLGVSWVRSTPRGVVEKRYPGVTLQESDTQDAALPDGEYNTMPVVRGVTMIDYYQRPYGNDPGCFARFANNVCVEDRWVNKYPYKYTRKLPFTQINENELSDGLFGFPGLELVLNQQVQLNKAEGLLAELRKFLPKLLVKKESGLTLKDVKDITVSILEYFGEPGAVQYIAPPLPSPSLIQGVNMIPQNAEHTLGLHETLMRGQSVGSLQSGLALQHLSEQDVMRIFSFYENLKTGYEEHYEICYDLIRQYYPKAKIEKILGDKAPLHMAVMEKYSLSPMTFMIETGSLIPKSKAIESDKAMQAAQYGAIDFNDRKQRRSFIKIALPGMAKAFSSDVREETMARDENRRLLAGERVVPDKYDEHEIHLDVHFDIYKDPRFRKIKKKKQDLVVAHIEAHIEGQKANRDEAMKFLAEQQAMAAAQGGGAGGPGVKPGPTGAPSPQFPAPVGGGV